MKLQKIVIVVFLGIIAKESYSSERSYLQAYDILRRTTATENNLEAFIENLQTIEDWIKTPKWNTQKVSQRLHIKDVLKFIAAKKEEITRIQSHILHSKLDQLKKIDVTLARVILHTKTE